MSHKSRVFSRNPCLARQDAPHLIVDSIPRFSLGLQQSSFSRQGPVHSGITVSAVAIFVTGMALGTSSRRVLLQRFPLPWVAAGSVGDRMLEVRMAAMHPRLVHANFELAGSGDGRDAAAAVVILVQCVDVVAVPCTAGGFNQRVNQNDH